MIGRTLARLRYWSSGRSDDLPIAAGDKLGVERRSRFMVPLINLLAYQSSWFIAVVGASHGRVWPAWTAASLLFMGHLIASDRRTQDLRLGLFAVLLGMALDGLLASTGLLHYSPARPAVPLVGCPSWILALWVAFSTTLTRSLGWLRGRTGNAIVVGAVGGPLGYWAAARGWGVVTFRAPAWTGVLVLAIGWGLALGALVSIAARVPNAAATEPASPKEME